MLSGCLALTFLFLDKTEWIALCIGISLLADFLDGLVARALHVSSPIGKELDSLADVVSFGVVPGFLLLYVLVKSYFNLETPTSFTEHLLLFENPWHAAPFFFPLLITLFSALRLAKFNIATNQSKEFMGLATPAASLLVLGVFMLFQSSYFLVGTQALLVYNVLALVIAFLLMSNIPMFSFKLEGFAWEKNAWQYVFVALSAVLLIIFKMNALAFIIALYVLINVLRMFIQKPKLD